MSGRPETLREQSATGCSPDAGSSASGAVRRQNVWLSILPCTRCGWMPEDCPCGKTPAPCLCGGPDCGSRPREYRPPVKARAADAGLDETVVAVIRKVGRAA